MPELAVRTNTEQPGLLAGASRREPVSIICVFNDPEVRQRCLDRSIEEHRDEASLEYLPIDNVDGSFATAGAALNHGASLARHEHLAFVHQDVYLHSLAALGAAAGAFADDPGIGLLGAVGVDASGGLVGRIRDRVTLLGEHVDRPTEVASLDEVFSWRRAPWSFASPLRGPRARLARVRDRVRAPGQAIGPAGLRD